MGTCIYDAKYWQARALELRAAGEEMRDPVSKQTILQIADDYDELVQAASSGFDLPEESAARLG